MTKVLPDVWQMAAGEKGRFYSDVFLRHDVMFLGPGTIGEYEKNLYREAVEKGWVNRGIASDIASFHGEVTPGSLVLMRNGHKVKAIGIVAPGGYAWSDVFDDVHGWDLQHVRRVIWQEQLGDDLEKIQASGPLFGHRKQIHTFTRVWDEAVLGPIRSLAGGLKERALKPLPDPLPRPLTLEEVGQQLFARGISHSATDHVIAAIERQRRLLRWYREYGGKSGRPTEHEVVAHTVLPLLLALGWSEQLLAVEWNKIDLAAFSGTPTTAANCVLVCEAKSRHHGLQDVREQAFGYAKEKRLEACQRVLVTDGGRFYVYDRASADGPWSAEATGYLNVEKIRTNHLAPRGTNAIDTIVALTPTAIVRPMVTR